MEALQRELGRLEGCLKLTAVAESTLRESLERERERADAEWERAEALQLELERLREQLAEASIPQKPPENAPGTTTVGERRSWWRRFFGFR
jgi:regulator of replication initiation timing